ncbi:uncharacterized protein LOC126657648 [Mercurialis annua]|uniref:uncharacterized protein LOC126657648 n=1 Tax=Mercurialis annua TaxID=3986 RepID=UPI00215E86B4|nr:uncharacterized protein LOC126657648 [Mercurialis annua]XP_050208318.1 uncharacterized protein LOC126657648 [Mercurialis annua]
MQLGRWRNISIIKSNLIPPFSQSTTKTQFASIHSTPTTAEKRKNKGHNNHTNGFQQPAKNYARYAIRERRADTKRALRDLLFRSGATRASLQDDDRLWASIPEQPHTANKKRQQKHSAQNIGKFNHKKSRSKSRKESFSEDDDPETMFQATFGNRWYTWSFNASSFQRSTFGFEWREEHSNQTHHRNKKWNSRSDTESDDEPCSIGSCHDRRILGLPANGPLKIEDVKNAFRMSALKWHPDRHQGPSQAMAGEKFKLCVDAYKSLCDALS